MARIPAAPAAPYPPSLQQDIPGPDSLSHDREDIPGWKPGHRVVTATVVIEADTGFPPSDNLIEHETKLADVRPDGAIVLIHRIRHDSADRHDTRRTEVTNCEVQRTIQQNVATENITVDDAMLVKIVKADRKLAEPLSLKVDAGSCSGLLAT